MSQKKARMKRHLSVQVMSLPPKKAHRGPISTWKDTGHYQSLQKCKSKSQWDSISLHVSWYGYNKKHRNGKYQVLMRMWRTCCLWECKRVQPLWKTFWQFLKWLNLQLLNDTAISLISIYPHKLKAEMQIDTCTLMLIAALFKIVQRWKWFKYPPKDEQISKMWHIHIMTYDSTIKRNAILIYALLTTVLYHE